MSKEEMESNIKSLLTRGVSAIYPSKEFLDQKLKDGRPLTIYFGIDPTGPSLHLGHAVGLMKLRQFQDLGHNIIVLYGGFTAQIGDPTDKLSARQPLSPEQIKKNTTDYKRLIGKILNLGKTNIKFLDNEEWSNKLKPADMLRLASQFTVAQLLERDMFQERIKQGKEIYLNEFLYPVFQAYDAVTMDVDVQIGGNDQIFNMLAGRTLMRKMKNKEKAVLAMKLLVDSDDKKMGKTEGNMIALDEEASQMFGKVMSWPDELIRPGLELCTNLPMVEVEEIDNKIRNGMNPRDAKLVLAEEIVKIYHGEAKALKTKNEFIKTFSEKLIPSDIKEAKIAQNSTLVDVFELIQEAGSKTQLRRLIAAGSISNAETKEKIIDPFFKIDKNIILRIGSHRFLRITVNT